MNMAWFELSNMNDHYSAEKLFIGTDFFVQFGTSTTTTNANARASFDNGDYLVYASANFGTAGSTKGIRINYSKGGNGGMVEVRLGLGTTGRIIGEFRPAKTGSWSNYMTAYFDIEEDVEGIHDITFVSKSSSVLNLAWFELSDFSERSEVYSRIPASEYSDQSGTQFGTSGNMGYFDDTDYITYANVNFGPAGTTDLILIEYAKGNNGGRVQVRLDGADGTLVGEFRPNNSGGWGVWKEANIALDDVEGIHDLTFLAKGKSGVMNMAWFELSRDTSPSSAPSSDVVHTGFVCEDRQDQWQINQSTRSWCFWARKTETASRCALKDLYIDCPVTCDNCP